jgi:hypothetical protein
LRQARAQPETAKLTGRALSVTAHMESIEATESDQVRLRRHRPARPDLKGSSAREIDAEAVLWPLSVLTGVLGRDPAFRGHCAAIADGSLSVEDVARRYVRRDWTGRRVIAHLLRVGATRGVAMLSSECSYAVHADEPVAPGDRRRGARSNAQHKRGADLLARLGANACLADGCRTAPRAGPYCHAHWPLGAVQDADKRAMRQVLKGAAAALARVDETRSARMNWSSPGLEVGSTRERVCTFVRTSPETSWLPEKERLA